MLVRGVRTSNRAKVKRDDPSSRSKVEIATAATAVASIGTLVGLTVSGVLMTLPLWAATMVVVAELLAPVIVFAVMKRGKGEA
jgi:hypothetical protein